MKGGEIHLTRSHLLGGVKSAESIFKYSLRSTISKNAPAPRPDESGGRERLRRQAGSAFIKKNTGLLWFFLSLDPRVNSCLQLQYFIHHFIQSSSSLSYTTRRVPLPERERNSVASDLWRRTPQKLKSKEIKVIKDFQVLSKPDPS